MATIVSQIAVRVTASTAGLRRGLQKARRSIRRSAKQMERTGRTLSMGLTAPLAAAGGAATKMAADFDRSMNEIVGLVGISRRQVEAWKGEIQDLSTEVAKSPKELADAMFFITSAGLRGKEALAALRESSKAAAAGLGETKDVADAVTSAMNAYGSEALSAQQATDTLVKTVREGKLEADALGGSVGQVIPQAAQMGVSFEEVGAAIATMTRTGTEASTAARQLRQVLMKMLTPTKQAKKALEGTGTSFEDIRTTIREEGLLAGLQQLRSVIQEAGIDFSKVVPRARALTGVLQLVGKNADQTQDIFGSLQRSAGATQDAFDATDDTLRDLNRAWVAMRKALVSVGKQLAPLVASLARRIKSFANSVQQASASAKAWYLALASISAAAGPLLFTLGKLVSTVYALGAALASISWPVAAALALGAAAAVVVNRWKELSGFFGKIWADIKTMFQSGTKLVGLLWRKMTSSMRYAFAAVAKEVIGVFSDIATFASSMGVSMADPFAAAFSMLEQLAVATTSTARQEMKKTATKISSASGEFAQAGVGAFARMMLAGERFASATKGSISEVAAWAQKKFSALQSMFMMGEASGGGVPVAPLTANPTRGIGQNAGTQIEPLNVSPERVERLRQKVSQFWESFSVGGQKAQAVNRIIVSQLRSLGSGIQQAILSAESMGDAFASVGRKIVQSLKAVIAKLATMAVIAGALSRFGLGAPLGLGSGFGSIFSGLLGLQHGGLAMGPTIAAVGEGPRTGPSNPEVVAPLNKLKGMIGQPGGGRQGGTLEARIGLDELIFRLEQRRNTNRS